MKFVPDHRLLAFLVQVGLAFAVHLVRADEKPMMKAEIAHEYGAPEVLKFEEVPRPEPKEDEALVRVNGRGGAGAENWKGGHTSRSAHPQRQVRAGIRDASAADSGLRHRWGRGEN